MSLSLLLYEALPRKQRSPCQENKEVIEINVFCLIIKAIIYYYYYDCFIFINLATVQNKLMLTHLIDSIIN